jgi:dihydroxyacetone kinase
MSAPDVVRAVGHALVAARDRLNEADSAAGDGDLGNTAVAIGETLIDLASGVDAADPVATLRKVGLEIGSRAPSTFGTLVSLGLIGASRASAEAPDAEPTPTELGAELARAMEASISRRGKAARGGKTLLDALGPAADALHAAAVSGTPLGEALANAAAAAETGAEATRNLEPTMGRQAWLADRARGTTDPGAIAIAIAFRAASEALTAGGD